MLKNPKILKACQEILDKSPTRYFSGEKANSLSLPTVTKTTTKKMTTVEILFGRNDNSKKDRLLKMQGKFRQRQSSKKETSTHDALGFDIQFGKSKNSSRSKNRKLEKFNFG